jgi:hypothetical protein
MPLPTSLLAATPPPPLAWELVVGDSAVRPVVWDAALNCAGCFLEIAATDPDGAPLFAGQISIDWLNQSQGSFQSEITLAGTAALAHLVDQDELSATIGWFSAAIVDHAVTPTERRTVDHGALILRYSARAP